MHAATTPATSIVADPAALEAIFASLLADLSICPRRLMDAASLLANVERTATPGLWLVVSATDPTTAYHVQNGACNCMDAQRRDARRCKHALSCRIAELLERRETEHEQAAIEESIPYELTEQALDALDAPRTPADARAELYPDDAA